MFKITVNGKSHYYETLQAALATAYYALVNEFHATQDKEAA